MATPSPAAITVQGVALECRWVRRSEEERPAIVMLHEGLGSVSLWRDFPDRLAERTGLDVFVYSRQGYGASDPIPGPREPDYMHREAEVVLPAVLDAAGIDRPILFGHSDGGSIALLFAAAYPGAARALVLEAPHVFVEPLTLASIAEGKTAYETTDLPSRLGRHHADVEHSFWRWNDIWLDPRFVHWNIEDRLPRIDCPILLIQGLDDPYGTRAQLDAIAAGTGRAEIVLLEACGHSPHKDQMQATLDHTARFLAGLGQAEAA